MESVVKIHVCFRINQQATRKQIIPSNISHCADCVIEAAAQHFICCVIAFPQEKNKMFTSVSVLK